MPYNEHDLMDLSNEKILIIDEEGQGKNLISIVIFYC